MRVAAIVSILACSFISGCTGPETTIPATGDVDSQRVGFQADSDTCGATDRRHLLGLSRSCGGRAAPRSSPASARDSSSLFPHTDWRAPGSRSRRIYDRKVSTSSMMPKATSSWASSASDGDVREASPRPPGLLATFGFPARALLSRGTWLSAS